MTNPAIGDWFGITFDFTLNPVWLKRPPFCVVPRTSFFLQSVTVTGGVVHYTSILNGFIPYDTDDDLCTVGWRMEGSPPCSPALRLLAPCRMRRTAAAGTAP